MPDANVRKPKAVKRPAVSRSRERAIEREIRAAKATGLYMQRLMGEENDTLSVYSGMPFPLSYRPEGEETRFPQWIRLSEKFRLKIATLLLQEWQILAFDIKIHPDLEKVWVAKGKRIPDQCRDRIRKELSAAGMKSREFLFVIEGRSYEGATRLHLHGGVVYFADTELKAIERALERAVGKGVRGRTPVPRDIHFKEFYGSDDGKWERYMTKYIRHPDKRISGSRIAMSLPLIQAARDFYEWITGLDINKKS